MELTKGMFGSEFNSNEFFGLRCGQMRGRGEFGHNAGWYNKFGEKLGFGDLSAKDVLRLRDELAEGEMFVVISEYDSFWKFVKHNPGTIGADCVTAPTESAPGRKYISEKAYLAIRKGEVLIVGERNPSWYEERLGAPVRILDRGELFTLMQDRKEA